MSINYQQVVEDSIAELSALTQKKRLLHAQCAQLEMQTEKTRRTLHWAAVHLGQNPTGSPATSLRIPNVVSEEVSYTEAIRSVLKTYPVPLTPVMVRDLLTTVGFDVTKYQKPLPTIHVILRRLVASQEVVRGETRDRKSAYVWNHAGVSSSTGVGPRSLALNQKTKRSSNQDVTPQNILTRPFSPRTSLF